MKQLALDFDALSLLPIRGVSKIGDEQGACGWAGAVFEVTRAFGQEQ